MNNFALWVRIVHQKFPSGIHTCNISLKKLTLTPGWKELKSGRSWSLQSLLGSSRSQWLQLSLEHLSESISRAYTKEGCGAGFRKRKCRAFGRRAKTVLFMDHRAPQIVFLSYSGAFRRKHPLNWTHWIVILTCSRTFQKEIFCSFPRRPGICQPQLLL